ncbi:hypothetical protein ACFL1H_03835 [Nanoarchaeota archaeon]
MVYTVSIRNTDILEKRLRNKEDIEPLLNDEIKHNSKVFNELLKYSERMMPEFKLITDEERKLMSDTIAYMIRTDNIKTRSTYGPTLAPETQIPKIYGEDGIFPHLKNNPDNLHPEFVYDGNQLGAEIFRCLTGVVVWIPGIADKLDENSTLNPAFKMADMLAYLLDTKDLLDYKYTEDEKNKYHKALAKDMSEI